MGAIVSHQQSHSHGSMRSNSESNISSQFDEGMVEDDSSIKLKDMQHHNEAVKWKILPSADEAKAKFQKDGTLSTSNADQLELRMMLDDPIAQRYLFITILSS
jgi:hypothetical protein